MDIVPHLGLDGLTFVLSSSDACLFIRSWACSSAELVRTSLHPSDRMYKEARHNHISACNLFSFFLFSSLLFCCCCCCCTFAFCVRILIDVTFTFWSWVRVFENLCASGCCWMVQMDGEGCVMEQGSVVVWQTKGGGRKKGDEGEVE